MNVGDYLRTAEGQLACRTPAALAWIIVGHASDSFTLDDHGQLIASTSSSPARWHYLDTGHIEASTAAWIAADEAVYKAQGALHDAQKRLDAATRARAAVSA